jgi:tetratricopeptide (TPR) repeat protein
VNGHRTVHASHCSDVYSHDLFAKQVIIEVKVNNLSKKAIVVLSALGACALLIFAALVSGTVGLLTDPRANVSKELLARGASFVPNSAALNARLAEVEMGDEDRDLQRIENLATRAVNSSPWDYRQRLLLATVKEAQGDRGTAEQSLQQALALAPNYAEVHWRLANLLLREGKLARSIAEFRSANLSNAARLAGTLDLLWRVSGGNIAPLQAVTPRDPKSQFRLAQFLLQQSRAADAITVVSGIDRSALVGLPEVSGFVTSLMSAGRLQEARGLWVGLVSGLYAQPGRPLPGIWNGGFELDISKNLANFDWNLNRDEYAVPIIDSNTAHTGGHSLRIDFTGRDTTRLEGQVKQTLIVRPGARYRLECYVKTERFESPEGPRIVVADFSSSAELAKSDPVPAGSNDWRLNALDFTAPASGPAVILTIKRIPKFSYDNPTRGTIWLDDFVLTELAK